MFLLPDIRLHYLCSGLHSVQDYQEGLSVMLTGLGLMFSLIVAAPTAQYCPAGTVAIKLYDRMPPDIVLPPNENITFCAGDTFTITIKSNNVVSIFFIIFILFI